VDKKSATLELAGTREKVIALEANHAGICKFNLPDGADYELVSGNIIQLAERAVKSAAERKGTQISEDCM
jgi:hypothetical protein